MAKNKNNAGKKLAAAVELVPVLQAPRREGFDISRWRSAIKQAEDPDRPGRVMLYDIYNDILLDAHLSAIFDKRVEKLLGTTLTFTDKGKDNEGINELIETPWFGEMLTDILASRFWGYTASWLDFNNENGANYRLLDRRHIVPERGVFLRKQDDRDGVDITRPPVSNYVITAGKVNDLGLLLKATPWVLLKRGDVSDWATFNEILAGPIRVGKYPVGFPEVKRGLEKAVAEQGAMPYYLIPEGTTLDLVQGETSGSVTAYKELADFCDKQLSKLFLHSTMTLDAEGGQYKGDVHAESESAVHKSDLRHVLNVLNTRFRELLFLHGFNPGEGRFRFVPEEHICLKDRLEMDMKIAGKVEIPPGYFYEKYNIPVPEGGPKNVEAAPPSMATGENAREEGEGERRRDPGERERGGRFSRFFG